MGELVDLSGAAAGWAGAWPRPSEQAAASHPSDNIGFDYAAIEDVDLAGSMQQTAALIRDTVREGHINEERWAAEDAAEEALFDLLLNSLGDQLEAFVNLAKRAGKRWEHLFDHHLREAAVRARAA